MIWQKIPGTNYAASNTGLIKNLSSDKQLKPVLRGCGYFVVTLHGRQEYVHRMVLYAFTGYLSKQGNHKDLNKLNNCLENLEWVTAKQNIQHYLRRILEVNGQLTLML